MGRRHVIVSRASALLVGVFLALVGHTAKAANAVALLVEAEGVTTSELDNELALAGFAPVRLRARAFEDRDIGVALADAHLRTGLVLSARGRLAVIAIDDDARLTVKAEFMFAPGDRLARRQVWTLAVETLRLLHQTGLSRATSPATNDGDQTRAHDAVGRDEPGPTPPPAPPPVPPNGRALGAALAMGVWWRAPRVTPSSHVVFTGVWGFGDHWDLSARMLWPVFDAYTADNDRQTRLWTFEGDGGLDRRWNLGAWRPFVGATIGVVVALADTTVPSLPQTQVSGGLGVATKAQVGVRLHMPTGHQWLATLEAGRNNAVGTVNAFDGVAAVASAWQARLVIGVLFDR